MFPLSRKPDVSVRDLDEARNVYSRLSAPVTLLQTGRRRFAWDASVVMLGNLELSVHRFGDGFSAATTESQTAFNLTVPIGAGRVDDDRGHAHVPGREATFRRGGTLLNMRFTDNYVAMGMRIPEQALRDAVRALDGIDDLTFEPSVNLVSHGGQLLFRSLQRTFAMADKRPSAEHARSVAETFLFDLLVTHTRGSTRRAESRAVKLGLEYLRAHAGDPVRMSEVAAAAGTSVRMLQNGIKAYRGHNVTQFIRSVRMTAARRRLLAEPSASITQIALSRGFTHLGRFSVAYRSTFGESPRETRSRAR